MKNHVFTFFYFFLSISVANANDGFYQGSGTSLVPVKTQGVRVISEKLIISPLDRPRCYDVYLRGVLLREEMPSSFEDASDGEYGSLKLRKGDCEPFHSLRTVWQAKVIYRVVAEQEIDDALLAFPVPTWRHQYIREDWGLTEVPVPAVTGFVTKVGAKLVPDLGVQKVVGLGKLTANDERTITLAYQWKSSFSAGKVYEIETEYEFGGSYDTNMLHQDSERLWFAKRCGVEGQFGYSGEQGCPDHNAQILEYFLTPISTWGNVPPISIDIIVNLPKSIGVQFINPKELKPSCVDIHQLTYSFKNVFPTQELQIRYPDNWQNKTRIRTEASVSMKHVDEWRQFRKMMGGKAQLTCRLRDKLASQSNENNVKAIILSEQCVQACSSGD